MAIPPGCEIARVNSSLSAAPFYVRCGYRVLGDDFQSADVLADPALREGIKAYTNWPTIPQLYVKGEFIGGADIVREMFQAGELQTHLQEQGVAVKQTA